MASDEVTSVERLRGDGALHFRQHQSFDLGDLIQLPAVGTNLDQEIDIEGMDFDGSFLWLVGSHSIKRKKIEKGDPGTTEKKIKKIAKTEAAGNRFILARIPLIIDGSTGEQNLVRKSEGQTLTAAQLDCSVDTSDLMEAIRDANDLHLMSFLNVSGKDNGFDIEGLAVSGERLFIGLRGPVLRGWAMVLELSGSIAPGYSSSPNHSTSREIIIRH